MFKLLMVLMLTLSSVSAYNNFEGNVVVTAGEKYIKVKVKCDGECKKLNVDKVKLLAIAKLKSVKSWARIFKSGYGMKMIKMEIVNNTECVITYIICHSADEKIYDSSFGIEILYKEG